MELRHLRYFVAVAEELHFGRAAERLHIAQPPLSQQIRRLEQELGVELFRRNRRRVELTDAGRLLLEQSRPLLAQADHTEKLLGRASAGEVGRLSIGFVGSASYEVLPAILHEFRNRFPEVELRLEEQTTGDQVDALNVGRIDVGLVRPPVADDSIELTPLVEERLIAALPEAHPLAERATVPVAALAQEPFVLPPRRLTGLYEDVIGVCREAGFSPQVVQEAGEMQTIVSLVSAGIGVSLVPESVETFRRPRVAYRPLRGPNASLEIALARRRDDRSPLVAQFREVARTVRTGARPARRAPRERGERRA
jgi:DNA-binding transcriptional LysR family regulator